MEMWIVLAMIVALVVVGVAIFTLRKEMEQKPDYRVFFILGVTWLPLGIATDNTAFLALGAVFMVIGLANRDKWKEQPKLSEMPEEQRRVKIALIVGLAVLLLVALGIYLLSR